MKEVEEIAKQLASPIDAGPGAMSATVLRMIHSVPRNDAVNVLWYAYTKGFVRGAALAAVLPDAWSGPEFPMRRLKRQTWLQLFSEAGFCSDKGRPAPTEPIEVWRAQVGRTLGLAWTTDRKKARWFHSRNLRVGLQSTLLRGIVTPRGVLAFIDGRNENEVIVHPRRVKKVVMP